MDVLPFYIAKDRMFYKKIVSLPFDGAYGCNIQINKRSLSTDMIHSLVKWSKENKINLIEIRTRCQNAILENCGFMAYPNLICHEIKLTNMDVAWANLTKGHKWSVNKFKKKNYRISFESNFEDLKCFYKIMSKNMRLYGTPMYPFSYFKNLWEEYKGKDNVKLLKCMDGEKIIGGALILINHETAIYKYCSVTPTHIKDGIYHGMLWNAIQYCINSNCKYLNLGTSFINDDGLIYFKNAFGANKYIVYSYLYNEKTLKYQTVEQLQHKYRYLIKGWRYLPLPLTEFFSEIFWKNFC